MSVMNLLTKILVNEFGKEDNFKSLIAKGLRPFDIDSDIKNVNKSNENIFVVR